MEARGVNVCNERKNLKSDSKGSTEEEGVELPLGRPLGRFTGCKSIGGGGAGGYLRGRPRFRTPPVGGAANVRTEDEGSDSIASNSAS